MILSDVLSQRLLTEAKTGLLTSKKEIQDWMKECHLYGTVGSDLTVDIDGDIYVHLFPEPVFRAKIVSVSGDIHAEGTKLKALTNWPLEVDGSCHLDSNRLTSLDGAPVKVGGTLTCGGNPLKTLVGLPKSLSVLSCKSDVPLLQLALVRIDLLHTDNQKINDIVNGHLDSPPGKRRLLELQQALIDAGFEKVAKL